MWAMIIKCGIDTAMYTGIDGNLVSAAITVLCGTVQTLSHHAAFPHQTFQWFMYSLCLRVLREHQSFCSSIFLDLPSQSHRD